MKNLIKNICLVLCAATVMMASVTAFATPTSEPARKSKTISASDTSSASTQNSTADTDDSTADTADDTSSEDDTQSNTTTAGAAASGVTQNIAKPIPTAISTGQDQTSVVQNTEAQRAAEKKYASKGSIAVWFILSILINAVLSFLIGNRFYKLARKESHVTSEIRALRRDLEEKFANSVGGFTEMEMDVTNSNDNYSMNGSIRMPDRKSTDFASESDDVFKKWEDRMSQRRRPAAPVPEDTDENDEIEQEEEAPRKKFRPTREAEIDDDNDYIEEDEDDEPSKMQSVKDKAKNILGDIFPFKED